MRSPVLEFDGISKRFPGVTALDRVSLGVAGGRIHALLGANGAGKSTLLKILGGAHPPDAGEIRIRGRPHAFCSPREAFEAGIAIIHQELHLVPALPVEENLLLGHLPQRLGWLKRRELRSRAREALAILGEEIDPAAPVRSLAIGQRQMVEIMKALLRDAEIIAFDEPTSSLSEREVGRLFEAIRELAGRGRAVVYVSHRLQEVRSLCDSATVLRDGKVAGRFDDLAAVHLDDLVSRMVGRSIDDIYRWRARPIGKPALEIDDLRGPGLAQGVSLTVARGEIVGLFGLVGAGRTELLKLLCGARRPTGGAMKVAGKPVEIRTPRDAVRCGIGFCSEDRAGEGILAVRSVLENLNIAARHLLAPHGLIRTAQELENAAHWAARLRIKFSSLGERAAHLSGGNQQKVLLGRWLPLSTRVLLLDEPTRGIDVGAKSEIYTILFELAHLGMAILFASSELPEVLGLADRIGVMCQGRLIAVLGRDQATEERLLTLALPSDATVVAAHRAGSEEND
ncbi:MAG: L-arabinose ABC transporter ATP-binding protein AraG [Planctomycetota bacterium]